MLPKIRETLATTKHAFQIVVCDDGSSDGTLRVLESYKHKLPLTVIAHKMNRGLGETIRDLFEYAAETAGDTDIIVRMDCDDTHDPRYIKDLVARIDQGFDIVTTSRFAPGGGQRGVDSYRSFISLVANFYMRFVFRIPGLREYSCGYRAYRASLIKRAIAVYGNNFIQLRGLGFTCTLEKIVKLNLLGARFSEVPFVLRYNQKVSSSKMVSSITTFGYFVLALLYHWPWGGWRNQFKHLRSSVDT